MRRLSLSFMVCVFLALSACVQPETTPSPTVIINCVESDLVVPQSLSPFGGELVDTLYPEYSWQSEYDCAIHYYRVEAKSAGGTVDYVQTGPFVPTVSLDAATEYQWRVAAVAWDGSVGPFTEWATFVTGPLCNATQAWRVVQDDPVNGLSVIDASPDLTWHYPDGSCVPDSYDFAVFQGSPDGSPAISGNTGGSMSGFQTGLSYLQDCQAYYWRVDPIIAGTKVENAIPSYFVTNFNNACLGLPCDAGSLVAPIPLTPKNGETYTETYPTVTWEYSYPVCLNNIDFHIEIARDDQFDSVLVWGDTRGWQIFNPAAAIMEDCTNYYWHVAAVADGVTGPYSETFRFHTDFTGTCRRSASVDKTVACYQGPSTLYPLVAWLNTGDKVDLLGRSDNSEWLYIDRPEGKGACWIDALRLPDAGNIADLPVQVAPPLVLPTATPEQTSGTLNCSEFTSIFTCKSPCIWSPDPTHAGSGTCKNP
jgi:hypothetical protein